MEVLKVVGKLEKSKVFKDFEKNNPDFYLVHVFTTIVKDEKPEWDIGYYNKDQDMMVVFKVNDNIVRQPEAEVFKKNPSIASLEIDKVKLDYEQALKLAIEEKNKTNKAEQITKKILILQKIDITNVYNITLITTNFNLINIRINSETGQIVSTTQSSVLSLGQKIK